MSRPQTLTFTWLHPNDCIPPHELNLNYPYHKNKVEYLRQCFVKEGFDMNESALVGYPWEGKIQLLSGTHRHMAAGLADILLPVTLWLRSDIEKYWGTNDWFVVMEDIPVKSFE